MIDTEVTINYVIAAVSGEDLVGVSAVKTLDVSERLQATDRQVGKNLVPACTNILVYDVVHVIDDIRVVSAAADHGIGARAAVDKVIGVVTGQHLICVAANEKLDTRERLETEYGEIGVGGVEAPVCIFDYCISEIIDNVFVVPVSSNQCIGPAATIEPVGSVVTEEGVVARETIHLVSPGATL